MSPTHTNRLSTAATILWSVLLGACADSAINTTSTTTTDSTPDTDRTISSENTNVTIEEFGSVEPLQPVVSLLLLTTHEGVTRWKDTQKAFTGSTIVYGGGIEMFSVKEYRDGKELFRLAELEERPGVRYPEETPYQDAVRAYVALHGPDHDEYWFYERNGTERDLPVLLYGLRKMGEVKNGVMVCTRSHCLDALRKITREDVGVNYSDWAHWWRNNYNEEPPDWKPEEAEDS